MLRTYVLHVHRFLLTKISSGSNIHKHLMHKYVLVGAVVSTLFKSFSKCDVLVKGETNFKSKNLYK
jgi:hypothetical protein